MQLLHQAAVFQRFSCASEKMRLRGDFRPLADWRFPASVIACQLPSFATANQICPIHTKDGAGPEGTAYCMRLSPRSGPHGSCSHERRNMDRVSQRKRTWSCAGRSGRQPRGGRSRGSRSVTLAPGTCMAARCAAPLPASRRPPGPATLSRWDFLRRQFCYMPSSVADRN